MKTSLKNIYLVCYCVYLTALLLDRILAASNLLMLVSIFILSILGLLNLRVHGRKLKKSKVHLLIGGFVLWLVISTCACAFSPITSVSFSFTLKFILFMVIFFLSARVAHAYALGKQITIASCIIVGLFLSWRYIADFNGLEAFQHISDLFNPVTSLRYRESYGFSHPNGAGNLCYGYLVLLICGSGCVEKKYKNIFNAYSFITGAISAVMLVSTASRSSITSRLLFALLIFVMRTYAIKSKIARPLIVLTCIAVVAFTGLNLNIQDLLSSSNRLTNYTSNIPLLIENKRTIFGFGLVDPESFTEFSHYKFAFIDNYYLYILMTGGIVSLIFFAIGLVMYLQDRLSLREYRDKQTIRQSIIINAALLSLCYTSFFETCLLYPTFAFGFIIWTIALSYSCS